MPKLIRAALAAAMLLPLAGCFSYHEVPARQPDSVVVTPPPAQSGTVVVQPRSTY